VTFVLADVTHTAVIAIEKKESKTAKLDDGKEEKEEWTPRRYEMFSWQDLNVTLPHTPNTF